MGRKPAIESLALAVTTAGRPCDASEKSQILEDTDTEYKVKCLFTLPAKSSIKRPLAFVGSESSNTGVDCAGGVIGKASDANGLGTTDHEMISIRSDLVHNSDDTLKLGSDGKFVGTRPENVVIKNCTLNGRIRIVGLGRNGEAPHVKQSSTMDAGHTARARAAAPTNLTFDNITQHSDGTALYAGPGTTALTLANSRLWGDRGTIYLDAESYGNVLRGNQIYTVTEKREHVAIDGSGGNLIINNVFGSDNNLAGPPPAGDHGGIYLYRNCGQDGSVRIATPERNQIINNYFEEFIAEGEPAVWLGERDGDRPYCGLDSAFPWGSGSDDRDFARYNVVMQNRIKGLPLDKAILTGPVPPSSRPSHNFPNYVAYNEEVTTRPPSRLAGCFLPSRFSKDFIKDQDTALGVVKRNGSEVCMNQRCKDGVLVDIGGCSLATVDLAGKVADNDAGRALTLQCPAGTEIISVKAACELEYGKDVTKAQMDGILPGTVSVVRASDRETDGECKVGTIQLASGEDIVRGSGGATKLVASCKEKDANTGGDCALRVKLYCH